MILSKRQFIDYNKHKVPNIKYFKDEGILNAWNWKLSLEKWFSTSLSIGTLWKITSISPSILKVWFVLAVGMSVDEIIHQNTQNQSYLNMKKQSLLKNTWLSPAVNMMAFGVTWEKGLQACLSGNIFIRLIELGKKKNTYCNRHHYMGFDPRQ